MKNRQRPTARAISDGGELNVHSIFYTIQGEGPYAGMPSVFIRLADCNLQCPLCDTDYTGGIGILGVVDLVERCVAAADKRQVVYVITGGEPFRQNITYLVRRLHYRTNQPVQIETNGMLEIQGFVDFLRHKQVTRAVTVVVSPKTTRLHSTVLEVADCFKYVLSADSIAEDGLPAQALDNPIGAGRVVARPPAYSLVYINPADHKDPEINLENLEASAAAVMGPLSKKFSMRLGVQMHKLARLD